MPITAPHRLALGIVFATAIVASVVYLRQGWLPERNAGPREFAASRAYEALANVLGNVGGHPTGSLANERVRDRIVQRLRDQHYEPAVTRSFSCGRHGACAFVENIFAVRAGTDHQSAVMLSAHYDSVPAAQGANDDGLGVAVVLEVARALQASPTPRHDVYLLLTDGEERGLLGAEAFASEDTRIRSVRAVVNVESRGSSGPSLLFETTQANAFAVDRVARAMPRPTTSSLFSTIYEKMPNDTDFTVWKPHAIYGVNFATIGTLADYHTSLDRLDHVHRGTLQHQGDNALAAVTAFMNTPDLSINDEHRSVWFDLFSAFVVRYPEWLAQALSVACFVFVLVCSVWRARRRELPARALLRGILFPIATVVVAGALSFGLMAAFRALSLWPAPWIAHPWPFVATFALAAFLSQFAVAKLLARSLDPLAVWTGTALFVCLLHLLIAWAAPGASYLFAPAALAYAATSVGRKDSTAWTTARLAGPVLANALVWSGILILLPDALGFSIPVAHGFAWAIALLPALPVVATLRDIPRFIVWPAAVAASAMSTFAWAWFSPSFTPEHPMRANVVFHQAAVGSHARVLLDRTWSFRPFGPFPESMRRAMRSPREDMAFPWFPHTVLAEESARIAVDAPEALVLNDARTPSSHDISLRVRSLRGASTIGIVFPPNSTMSVTMANRVAASPRVLPSGHTMLILHAVPPEGVELSLTGGIQNAEAHLFDLTYDLPESAQRIMRARPRNAVPTQDGDVTVLTRRLVL